MIEVVDLGDDGKVAIKELKVKDVTQALKIIVEMQSDDGNDEDLDVLGVLGKADTIIAIIDRNLNFSGNDSITSIEDLTFSQIDKVVPKFKEVNASFLEKMQNHLGVDLMAMWNVS